MYHLLLFIIFLNKYLLKIVLKNSMMNCITNKKNFFLIFFYENIFLNIISFNIMRGIYNKEKITILSYYYLVFQLRNINC